MPHFYKQRNFHPWKAALTRISEAKEEAEKAKDNAQQARDKALDILSQVNKIEIPNLDLEQLGLTGSRTDGTQNIEKIAKNRKFQKSPKDSENAQKVNLSGHSQGGTSRIY